MKKRNGFTLIELLSVIVILGILAGISIPIISKLIRSEEKKAYQTHLNIVKAATDAYVDQYGQAFKDSAINSNKCSCFKIPYWAMIDEKLIKEENITCDLNRSSETKGFVIAKQLGDSLTNCSYEYYLECKDLKKDKIIHETTDIPKDCCGVNGNFMITELTLKYNDAKGEPYSGVWTNQNIYQHIESNNPYMAGVKGFEYSLDGGSNWIYVAGKDLTLRADVNTKVQVRAVDNENNKSTVSTYTARIDKTKPSGDFDLSGVIGTNDWYKSDVIIRTKNVGDGTGSGIASVILSHTTITDNTAGTKVTLTIRDNAGNVFSADTTVKIDKMPPVLNLKTLSLSYMAGTSINLLDASLVTATDAQSGLYRIIATINGTEYTNINTLGGGTYTVVYQAVDNAGNYTIASLTLIIQADLILLNGGDTCDAVTGGWNVTTWAGQSCANEMVRNNGASLEGRSTCGDNWNGAGFAWRTRNGIDFTNYNKLVVTYGTLIARSGGCSGYPEGSGFEMIVEGARNYGIPVGAGTAVWDVSGITGYHQVTFRTWASYCSYAQSGISLVKLTK